MTAPHADQIISGYLARLEQALAGLPPARRAELLDDVRTHIAEARRSLAAETDADLLNILDKLGDPADIAADARDRLGAQPAPPAMPLGVLEIAAIVALVLVWPAGVALVWLSSAWSQRDKLVATVLIPSAVIGFAMVGIVGGVARHFTMLALVLLFSPVVWSIGAIFLGVRLYQMRQAGSVNAVPTGPVRSGALEIGAIILTLVLWPVGVILLWSSTAWNVRDKLIGTLLPPGGYLGVAIIIRLVTPILGGGAACSATTDFAGNVTNTCITSGPPEWLPPILVFLMLVLLVLPVFTAAYLTARLWKRTDLRPALA